MLAFKPITAPAVAFLALLLGCGEPVGADPRRKVFDAGPNHPAPRTCDTVRLDDPARQAAINAAAGDLRVFTVHGFTPGDAPGVFCPKGDYLRLSSRGGTLVSDTPDVCGGHGFSNAPRAKMEAYNGAMAATPAFQKATGCRPATYCETKYKHGYHPAVPELDERCPNQPSNLAAFASRSSPEQLRAALSRFDTRSAAGRDALTLALIEALEAARWDNAKLLAVAGAEINGQARAAKGPRWLESPLATVFSQTTDEAGRVGMARWLIERGADFSNPEAQRALKWAALAGDLPAVEFLLKAGASPNGALDKATLDREARADIRTTHSAGPDTPFYAALESALRGRGRSTPADRAWAHREERAAKAVAVRLYLAGARFQSGAIYNNIHQNLDTDAISILLATAHRDGRLYEVLARLQEGLRLPQASREDSADRREMEAFVAALAACPTIRPRAETYRVKLCATGVV